eukprot:9312735-Alexandrium_andersonii.AAC.1
MVEPYLKSLQGWLATTRALKKQQGLLLLQHAQGDLKLVINELDIDDLTGEDSGDLVLTHIKKAYHHFLHQNLPRNFEMAIYDSAGHRQNQEGMLQYTTRKRALYRQLEKAGCSLPDVARGYVMMHDGKVSNQGWDTVMQWTNGSYEEEKVIDALRKLERPLRGAAGSSSTMAFFQTADAGMEEAVEPPPPAIYLTGSLFLLPE